MEEGHEGEGGMQREKEGGEFPDDSKHVEGRHTHESDGEDEVKVRKRRARHVPGASGRSPPVQSALAKKLASASVRSEPEVVVSGQSLGAAPVGVVSGAAPVRVVSGVSSGAAPVGVVSGAAPVRVVSGVSSGAAPVGSAQARRQPKPSGPSGRLIPPRCTFFVPLMDICRVDTPVLKRVPNSQRSNFATAWGKILDEAVFSKQEAAWSEFFLFSKCILWTPVRGGRRLAKKANMADVVRARLEKWAAGEKEQLWKDAVERSKKPVAQEAPKKDVTDKARLEARALAALRLGDVRKALQTLNSAPIAAKTEATLQRLRKLHPVGANPSPTPSAEPPRFTDDVVRTALSSFGPGSAAGLFGYKPLLLQQCVRSESLFTRALTGAVNVCCRSRAELPQALRGRRGIDCTGEVGHSGSPSRLRRSTAEVSGKMFLRGRQGGDLFGFQGSQLRRWLPWGC